MDNLITIESEAFRAIMNKMDRIDDFIVKREKEEEERKSKKIQIMTGEEVIRMLNISKQTLWRMRDRGDIAYVRHGNICLYTQEEVEKVINRKIIRRRRS